jgi:PKHD-type hydroxylase
MTADDEKEISKRHETNEYIGSLCTNPDFLTAEECNRIIESGKTLPIDEGFVGSASGATGKLSLYKRSSKIKWLDMSPDTAWLFERIRDAINYANCMYRFDLDHRLSRMQLAEYPVGGHYVWHSDISSGAFSRRKLSITVQLSNPDDYNGGDLEFSSGRKNAKQDLRKQGLAVIFPSFLEHRVTTVTKGSRWSIVAWICGPPFR